MMQKMLKTGEAGSYEKELRKKDGTLVPVEVNGWVKRDEQGEITGLWKINRDISKRKKAEDALRRSEIQYKTIFEGSNDAIVIMLLEGLRYVDMNPKVTELTGYTRTELLTKDVTLLATPRHLYNRIALIFEELKAKNSLTYDWEILTKAGETIPVQIFSKLKEIEGVAYVFSIIRDMRMIRQAQEVLKRDKEALEKLVRERTAALVRAERLSDLGTALATITHELKNPITAIDLAAYNIKRKTGEQDIIGRQLETIEKKVQESNQIIDDVLAFTRINPPRLQEINLYTLLKECEHTVAARHHGIAIKLLIRKETVQDLRLKADPVQLTEVLSNLLNNAYDVLISSDHYRQTGVIEVSAGETEQDIIISIKDNGPGIPQAEKEKLFEPFFTTKPKGTGLGLAISKRIIENHGGKITIESESGKGTIINIYLPKRE
jgi:PAS domain S-box-containing protein